MSREEPENGYAGELRRYGRACRQATTQGTNMSKLPELLPCPFCGLQDVENDEGCFHSPRRLTPEGWDVQGYWTVLCGNPSCNAETTGDTREEARNKWNTRHQCAEAAVPSHDVSCNHVCTWPDCATPPTEVVAPEYEPITDSEGRGPAPQEGQDDIGLLGDAIAYFNGLGTGSGRRLALAITRTIVKLTSTPQEAQGAVAWQYRAKDLGEGAGLWITVDELSYAIAGRSDNNEVRKLYLRPSPSITEAQMDAIRHMDAERRAYKGDIMLLNTKDYDLIRPLLGDGSAGERT